MNVTPPGKPPVSPNSNTPPAPNGPAPAAPIVRRVNSRTSGNLSGSKRASGEVDQTTNKLKDKTLNEKVASSEPSPKKGRTSLLLSKHRDANEPVVSKRGSFKTEATKPRSESSTEIKLDEERHDDVWGEAWKNLSREGGNITIIAKHVGETARAFFKGDSQKKREATLSTGLDCLDYLLGILKNSPEKMPFDSFRVSGNKAISDNLKKELIKNNLKTTPPKQTNIELIAEQVNNKQILINNVIDVVNSCFKDLAFVNESTSEKELDEILGAYDPNDSSASIKNMSAWLNSLGEKEKNLINKMCQSQDLTRKEIISRNDPQQPHMSEDSLAGFISGKIFQINEQLLMNNFFKIKAFSLFLTQNIKQILKPPKNPNLLSSHRPQKTEVRTPPTPITTAQSSPEEALNQTMAQEEPTVAVKQARPPRPVPPKVRQNTEQAPKIGHRPLPEPPKKQSISDSVVFSSHEESSIQQPNRASSPSPTSSPKNPPPLPPRPPSQPMKKSDSI